MIDLLNLFLMLFCAGYQTAPSTFTCPDPNDAKSNPMTISISDQEKADYYQWIQDEGYKDENGVIDLLSGS